MEQQNGKGDRNRIADKDKFDTNYNEALCTSCNKMFKERAQDLCRECLKESAGNETP